MGVRFMFGFSDTPNHPVLIKVSSIMCPLYVRFTGQLGWVLELEISRNPVGIGIPPIGMCWYETCL